MEEVRLYSSTGNGINHAMEHKVKGRYYPWYVSSLQDLDNVSNMAIYPDDVLISGYPKSGTNWINEIIGMLLYGETEIAGKFPGYIEFNKNENLQKLPQPRVLNTHLWPDEIPMGLLSLGCRQVYILRNPKDVCVSYYHFVKGLRSAEFSGDFAELYELFIQGKVYYGMWFNHIPAWEKFYDDHPEIPVYICHYEDLKEDFYSNLDKLAAFLGVNCSPDLREAIAKKTTLEAMKERNRPMFETPEMYALFSNGVETLCRKGQVGDWKNYFTVAQNEEFDTMFAEKMADSKLNIRYEI